MLPRGGVLALALLALPVQAQASEALWTLLKSGGQVVIMRHTSTDGTAGDPGTMRLASASPARRARCATWSAVTGATRWGDTLILVTHKVNITALTGLYPAEGEMIILTPQGGDFTVAGRVKPSDVTQN